MAAAKGTTKKTNRCPQCKKLFEVDENLYNPFCSERCKMVDLGDWFSEQYVIRKDEEEESGEK